MKRIIDITEEDYNNIEPFLNGQTIKGGFNLFKVLGIIKNGIPLDDVKVEGEDKERSEEKWEHISKLSEIRSKYSCFEDDEEPYYRALSEGIKALKQEPCEDAISRQAVDEIKELMTDINGDTVYAVRMSDIRQLPPVKLKYKYYKWWSM